MLDASSWKNNSTSSLMSFEDYAWATGTPLWIYAWWCKSSILSLSEEVLLHHAKLISGYWRFTAPFCIMSRMIYHMFICGYVLELHCSLLHHVSDKFLQEVSKAILIYDLQYWLWYTSSMLYWVLHKPAFLKSSLISSWSSTPRCSICLLHFLPNWICIFLQPYFTTQDISEPYPTVPCRHLNTWFVATQW
jgi:hypothetical protein